MNGPNLKIKDVIMEALTKRGFSNAEANQMIMRLIKYGENAEEHDPYMSIMPFGKHKFKRLGEIAETVPDYLIWLISQDWFRERFAGLYEDVDFILNVDEI